ncbi:MAG: DUF11 domain-containing protein [Chloroflexota bacterium]
MNIRQIHSERERRDWVIVLVILLIGFLCMGLAGERAIRISPFWKLNTNMRSNLDPDSAFLTSRPVGYYEPLDPSILTPPVWLDIFLTPGAQAPTRPPSQPSDTPPPTLTATLPPTATSTRVLPSSTATNTAAFFPTYTRAPSTATPIPPTFTRTPTPTVPPTPIAVDLSLTKTDGSATYTPGATVTYTIIVINNGPNNVSGATVTDTFPAIITSASWTCASTGAATCTPTGSGNLADTVNIPVGGTLTYTVTANTNPAALTDLVNTASVSAPPGYTETNPANNSATDTDAPLFSADLQITKTDNATDYTGGAVKTYTIVVANAGPSSVAGATVTDIFSTNPNIASAGWTCAGTGGGTCTAAGNSDINDTVSLPAGASVTYTVTANIAAGPSGSLVNTASVTAPSGVNDPAPGNNAATDTDTLITSAPLPPNMGSRDNVFYTLPSGSTLTLSINLTANGDSAPDLVFYEYSVAAIPPDFFDGILLDWIVIEISDGNNWYRVFYWGDGIRDTNTNADYTLLTLPPASPDPEEDQRRIVSSDLYNGTGVAIDIDSIVPPGVYTFIRFYAPTGDVDGQAEIDAFEILP